MRRLMFTACLVATLTLGAADAALASASASDGAFMTHVRRLAREKVRLTGAPTTVPTLNVTMFLGRWYEVLQDLVTAVTFQSNSFCATATYGPDASNASRITVVNREHYGSVTGPEVNVTGYAFQPEPIAEPGQLIVYLHGDNASPFPAPYWILKVGPENDQSQYDYAVVSDPFRLTLFVLARDVDRYFAKYDTEVRAFLRANGFTEFWNEPIVLDQTNCTYF